MKIFCCALVCAIVAASRLAAQPEGAQDAEFKQLISTYWQAWSTLNPDNAAPMYSKDADAVFFDVAPMQYQGWSAYKEGVKKVFGQAASAKFVPNDDVKATRHGDLAWTSETFHGSLQQRNGKMMELNGRHTTIWQKQNGKWLIVHEHVSTPLPE